MKCVYQGETYNVYGEVYKVSERLAERADDLGTARDYSHIQGYEYEMFLDFGDGSGTVDTWDSAEHANGERNHLLSADDAQAAINEVVEDCVKGEVDTWFTIR